jgi:ubiquinone/menaquinone biosynthesis C-methylase UbiE
MVSRNNETRADSENNSKKVVKDYWQKSPCGAKDVAQAEEGTLRFFEEVERMRYEGDDFMHGVVGFKDWAKKKVLEVGCGLGTDLLQFARGGANVSAIDLTEKGVSLTRQRLMLYGFTGDIRVGDSENLPFPDNTFDLVYSWGVIHHTTDTPRAAREIVRICKPGGRVLVMIYHRRSLLVLQAWLLYGLLRGCPWRSTQDILAKHVESPGTKAYTVAEAREMFRDLKDFTVQRIVTRFDLRIGRRRFLPKGLRALVPAQLGWFMIIKGSKN